MQITLVSISFIYAWSFSQLILQQLNFNVTFNNPTRQRTLEAIKSYHKEVTADVHALDPVLAELVDFYATIGWRRGNKLKPLASWSGCTGEEQKQYASVQLLSNKLWKNCQRRSKRAMPRIQKLQHHKRSDTH